MRAVSTQSLNDPVVIVIRAWIERHAEFPLRAIVTTTVGDASSEAHTSTSAKTPDEVCGLVRSTLDTLVARESGDDSVAER
jgi:hypothetical protein